MHILAAVFFEEYHQLVKPHLIGNVLYHRHIKHIRAAGLADGEDLLSTLDSDEELEAVYEQFMELLFDEDEE